MKYELYKADKDCFLPIQSYKGNKLELSITGVTSEQFGFFESLMWNVFCFGNCSIYRLYDDNVLVHSSLVARSKIKFPFLKKEDIEIGPCWTNADYRGRNIYPYILSLIIQKEIRTNGSAYMIIDDENMASIKGVSKVGFVNTGQVVKKDRFTRYILI